MKTNISTTICNKSDLNMNHNNAMTENNTIDILKKCDEDIFNDHPYNKLQLLQSKDNFKLIQNNDSSIETIIKTNIGSNNETNNECKIFVGNVPYQCTQEEFEKCFQNIDGFIKAEIITMYKTNMSRGFGFITMRSIYDAENLKHRDDILFKGRVLRFTNYQSDTHVSSSENLNNYIFVDGIPDGKDREWLKCFFSSYEPIGKCFVAMNHDTGIMKNNGVVEILDDSKYKAILFKRIHDHNNVILETTKYRTKLPHLNSINLSDHIDSNTFHCQDMHNDNYSNQPCVQPNKLFSQRIIPLQSKNVTSKSHCNNIVIKNTSQCYKMQRHNNTR
jgi:RNA recognition motif-containing protein